MTSWRFDLESLNILFFCFLIGMLVVYGKPSSGGFYGQGNQDNKNIEDGEKDNFCCCCAN